MHAEVGKSMGRSLDEEWGMMLLFAEEKRRETLLGR
jgi:hypothetical protein